MSSRNGGPFPLFTVFGFIFICQPVLSSLLVEKAGDYTIAAVLPVHMRDDVAGTCTSGLQMKHVVQTAAIVFAIEEINSTPFLTADKTLGLDIEDICSDGLKNTTDVINSLLKRHKERPVAFITDLPVTHSNLVALYSVPDTAVLTLGDARGQQTAKNLYHLVAEQPRLPPIVKGVLDSLKWPAVEVLVTNKRDTDILKDTAVCVDRVRVGSQSPNGSSISPNAIPLVMYANDVVDISTRRSSSQQTGDTGNLIQIRRTPGNLTQFRKYLWKFVQDKTSWLAGNLRKDQMFADCGGYDDSTCVSAVFRRLVDNIDHARRAIDAVYAIAHALNSKTLDNLARMPGVESPTGSILRFTETRFLREVDYEIYDVPNKVVIGNAKTFPVASNNVVELDISSVADSNTTCMTSCVGGVTPVPQSGSQCCVTCPAQNSSRNPSVRVCGERRKFVNGECIAVKLDYLQWRHPLFVVVMVIVVISFVGLLYLVNVYVRKANLPAISVSPLATVPLLLSIMVTLILPLLLMLRPGTHACNAYVFGFIHAIGIPLCILISRSYKMQRRFRHEDGSLRKKVLRCDPQNLTAFSLILVQFLFSILLVAFLPAHVVHYPTTDPGTEYIECSTYAGGEFLFAFFFVVVLTLFFSVENSSAVTREEDTYESHFMAIAMFGLYFLSFLMLVAVYGVSGKIKVMCICVLSLLYALNYMLFIFFPKIYVIVFKKDPASFSPFPLPAPKQILVLSEDMDIYE